MSLTVANVSQTLTWPAEDLGLSPGEKDRIALLFKTVSKNQAALVSSKESYHSMSFPRERACLVFEDGSEAKVSRSVYITKNHFIVALNGHNGAPTLKGGGQESKLKLGYDPTTGVYYVKKHIHSIAQRMLINKFLFETQDTADKSGFAEIVYHGESHGRHIYFEPKYDFDLYQYSKGNAFKVELCGLVGLQNALLKLHGLSYTPATLEEPVISGGKASSQVICMEHGGKCFHGDISPKNILCVLPKDSPWPLYKLSDFGFSSRFDSLSWTPGWASPEYIAYINQDPKYKGLSTADFNAEYGQKKDVWALGLLFGSILRQGFHPSFENAAIPCFTFIADKIKVVNGKFDESKLAHITQEEIDDKIGKIISAIDMSTEVAPLLVVFWQTINKWLTVDPKKRPNLSECHLAFRIG